MMLSPRWISSSVMVTPQLHVLRSRTFAFLILRPRVLIVPSFSCRGSGKGPGSTKGSTWAVVVSESIGAGLLETRGTGRGVGEIVAVQV